MTRGEQLYNIFTNWCWDKKHDEWMIILEYYASPNSYDGEVFKPQTSFDIYIWESNLASWSNIPVLPKSFYLDAIRDPTLPLPFSHFVFIRK